MTRICPRCKIEFPLTNFYKSKSRKYGHSSYCKSCDKSGVLKSQQKHRAKYNERKRKYHRLRMQDESYVIRINAQQREQRARLKAEFLKEYGNKCSCCGETSPEFLTLEHKNHDGREHRLRVGGSGVTLYRDLRRRGWPKDAYTLLCYNCNSGTARGNLCPHKIKESENLLVLESSLADSTYSI